MIGKRSPTAIIPAIHPAAQHRYGCLAAALTFFTASAHSEEYPTATMPMIEVVGTQDDAVSRQTGSVVIIEREQLELLQPRSTDDVLRRVPGVHTKSEEETSIVANFGIRGLSSSESKSLVLEDGVPVAPGLFIGNERYFNPRIQRMERIEILKGSASLRYGPSTIGGVVNFVTKTPDDGVVISSRVGSFNSREATVEAGTRSAAGRAFAGFVGTHARSDGFMDKDYEMYDLLAKAGISLNENHSVGVKLSYHENDANISYRGLFLGDYRAGRRFNPTPDDYFLTDRLAFDFNHEWRLNDRATLKTLVYWSDMTRDYWRHDVDNQASEAAGRWVFRDTLTGNNRDFERWGIESRLTLDHRWFDLENEAEFGVRLMTEESDDRRIRATRASNRTGINDRHIIDSADSIAGYATNRLQITDRLAITPGLRIESYRQKRKVLTENDASATTSNSELLPGLGATFTVNPSAQVFGGVYRAFSPAANGVALDGLQDQKLDGERSINYEIGVRGMTDRWTYEVAGFYMDFSNQVVTGNSDPNLSQSNAGKTEHLGLEFALGYELGAGFQIDANATWVPESKFKSGENRGNRIPYAPEYLGNLAITYTNANLRAAFTAHHQGSQFGDPTNLSDIPTGAAPGIWGGRISSYTVFDLTGEYALGRSLTLFGGVKNLTDKRYITGLRQGIYVGPERSVEFGFRYHP